MAKKVGAKKSAEASVLLAAVAEAVAKIEALKGQTKHKPKTLAYTVKLLNQWGASLTAKDEKKRVMVELREKYAALKAEAMAQVKKEAEDAVKQAATTNGK